MQFSTAWISIILYSADRINEKPILQRSLSYFPTKLLMFDS